MPPQTLPAYHVLSTTRDVGFLALQHVTPGCGRRSKCPGGPPSGSAVSINTRTAIAWFLGQLFGGILVQVGVPPGFNTTPTLTCQLLPFVVGIGKRS